MAAITSTIARRTKILSLAKSQLGVRENPAYSNQTPYTRWYGITGPWCAMFVSWVFYHAGLPLIISTNKGFAYCPYGVDWFKRNRAWASPTTRPQPGWVVFFNFPGDGIDRPSHVGIVEGVAGDGRIITIEGNTNAAGSRTGGNVMRHYRSRAGGIIGYGIINYKAATPPRPGTPAPTTEEDPMRSRIIWYKGEPTASGDQPDTTAAYKVLEHKDPDGHWYGVSATHILNQEQLNILRYIGVDEVQAPAGGSQQSPLPFSQWSAGLAFLNGPFKNT